MSESAVRRPRRHDPERRDRIVDATVDVIARYGVAGATHRLIAAAADVPLGSLTYHFDGLEQLRELAFRRLAEQMIPEYEAHFREVRSEQELVEAVTDLIHSDAGGSAEHWVLSYELYLAALRDPALRTVTECWMRGSRAVLERFVDPITARGIDALIEGSIMHKTLSTAPVRRSDTRTVVARVIAGTYRPRSTS